ncbi:hypothetical protein ACWF99_21940 [Nocardia sp. NPDC055002]|uniref:hypothetical protein n=1 Tax=Nocardia sp. NPDC056952 TaxID=3345979 RepID=UPI0036430F6E
MTFVRQAGDGNVAATRKRKVARKKTSRDAAPSAGRLAQVRLRGDEVQALEEVMRTLHLESTSDALREGLRLLVREATEVSAAEEIRTFYGDGQAPLPDGVIEPNESELAAADEMQW